MTLGALGSEDVSRLVEEHTGQADARLTSELVARTDGNPLLIAEALRMLERGGALAPSSVLGLIASRIEGLDRETAELLDAASVFGRRIVPTVLARAVATPLEQMLSRLGELTSRGVLRVQDDGRGAPEIGRGGYGLAGIRERAEQLGGRVAYHTAPGQGFALEMELPG